MDRPYKKVVNYKNEGLGMLDMIMYKNLQKIIFTAWPTFEINQFQKISKYFEKLWAFITFEDKVAQKSCKLQKCKSKHFLLVYIKKCLKLALSEDLTLP